MSHDGLSIAIDARYLSHGLVGGVHTYVKNLVDALVRLPNGDRYILWLDGKHAAEVLDLPGRATCYTLPWRSPLSSVKNDFTLGTAMVRSGAQIAHFPANYGCAPSWLPAVVTLHDAINLLPLTEIVRTHSKQPRSVAMMTYLHLMTKRAMDRQPTVITVSEYSRQQILEHASIAPERVHVVPSAPEERFRVITPESVEAARTQWRLRSRVLLADAIKNPTCVLRAYQALPRSVRAETSLVFFSRRTPDPIVEHAAARGDCVLLTRPNQEEMVTLFNLADLFVFPSWYEGFGLPVLEAMACGTPVIASSRGSLPEIVGDAGIIVDAEDHEAIAASVVDLFDHDERYEEAKNRSLRQAARFTWENTAWLTAGVYAEAYHQREAGLGYLTKRISTI
jgi:glycosyltransferase involved in cell wall biosynthesis